MNGGRKAWARHVCFAFGLALVAPGLTACAQRQATYSGPIIPIHSQPLVAYHVVYYGRSTAGGQRWAEHRRVPRTQIATRRSTEPLQVFQHPYVVTDPPVASTSPVVKAIALAPGSVVPAGAVAARPTPHAQSMVGDWKLVAPSGCNITLSSEQLVDVSEAHSTGCQAVGLDRLSGWKQEQSDVQLLGPGGVSIGRFSNVGGTLVGVIGSSGPLYKFRPAR